MISLLHFIKYLVIIDGKEVKVETVMHAFTKTQCNWSQRSHYTNTNIRA